PVLALILVAVTGAGAILVEILTETGLQRMLPAELFGRAYGLALPAAIAGIAIGSLIAPLLVSALGITGALFACGAAAPVFALTLPRMAPSEVPAADQPAPEVPVAGVPVAEVRAVEAPSASVPAAEAPTEILVLASPGR